MKKTAKVYENFGGFVFKTILTILFKESVLCRMGRVGGTNLNATNDD